jgi:hypothetical protein
MLLRSAMRAAVAAPRTHTACLLPCGARHVQLSLNANLWCSPKAAAPKPVVPAPGKLGTTTTAATAPLQRALSLRCYSNAQTSSSSSSTESSAGPRKLKYNLRPLNKGNTAQPQLAGLHIPACWTGCC